MNPEISNLMMQGYTIAEAQAEIKSWQIIPAPITVVHTPNGYVYSDGIARPDMQIDYSGPCAMTSDGQPCVVITLVSYGKYSPTEWDYESVENARHEVFLAEVERINQFRSERYQIGELELKVFPNSPQEMWDALNAAKTALERGNEFEIKSALENLRAAVNGPSVELVQLPLNDGQRAEQDSITTQMFNAVANREEFTAPPQPEPQLAEPTTKAECHARFIDNVFLRSQSKWRGHDMLKCRCFQIDYPHRFGFGRRNPEWKITAEEFTNLEAAAEQMLELTKKAEGKV